MNKLFLSILLVFLLMFSCFTSLEQEALAASIEDNSVIILSGNVSEDNKVIIKANMTVNTGIGGMTLELSYDQTAMVLTNVVFGTALSSLEPITTNPNTELGYAITPFLINYMGNANDYTTGTLFTLTFDLKDDVQDGTYEVALKYTKDQDVNYYDENEDIKTKNLHIDNAEIKIQNNSVVDIISKGETPKKSYAWIFIVVGVALGVAGITVGTVFVVKYIIRKRRKWEKV